MTTEERAALDQVIADLREEAIEVARVHNVSTEKAETLTEVANRLERFLVAKTRLLAAIEEIAATPAADVGDVPPA